METRHIRINYEDALSSKKHLLSSEINLLHVLKKIKAYKVLRRRELTAKKKLRVQLNSLRRKINLIQTHLPKEHVDVVKKKRKKVVEETGPDIQIELEDIKKKLDKLGE